MSIISIAVLLFHLLAPLQFVMAGPWLTEITYAPADLTVQCGPKKISLKKCKRTTGDGKDFTITCADKSVYYFSNRTLIRQTSADVTDEGTNCSEPEVLRETKTIHSAPATS